ncbi:hypothetical protein ALC57_01793 [Trachymyrmex cornetzi]|uniref:Uncharacterized protein n=1 Tax=Trachymyrmex cornetzi TaxID=471704 RepID=A0A195EKN3_9HYME|nr:hypothetical protein ALC57_01793 [Trachymyrmex cornetzi]
MPTAGPFKDILAKGTGDLVDSATGFANVFVVNIFLVFELRNRDGNCPACKMVHIDTIDMKFVPSAKNFSCSRKDKRQALRFLLAVAAGACIHTQARGRLCGCACGRCRPRDRVGVGQDSFENLADMLSAAAASVLGDTHYGLTHSILKRTHLWKFRDFVYEVQASIPCKYQLHLRACEGNHSFRGIQRTSIHAEHVALAPRGRIIDEGGRENGRPAGKEVEDERGGYSRHRNEAWPSSRIRCSSAGKRGVEERKQSIMSTSAQRRAAKQVSVKLGHSRHEREFSKHQRLKRSELPY